MLKNEQKPKPPKTQQNKPPLSGVECAKKGLRSAHLLLVARRWAFLYVETTKVRRLLPRGCWSTGTGPWTCLASVEILELCCWRASLESPYSVLLNEMKTYLNKLNGEGEKKRQRAQTHHGRMML